MITYIRYSLTMIPYTVCTITAIADIDTIFINSRNMEIKVEVQIWFFLNKNVWMKEMIKSWRIAWPNCCRHHTQSDRFITVIRLSDGSDFILRRISDLKKKAFASNTLMNTAYYTAHYPSKKLLFLRQSSYF